MRGMTSYAQAQRKRNGLHLNVTIRSGNSRYLEVMVHQLPPEKIILEEIIKKEIKRRITRGRIEVYFFLKHTPRQRLSIDKSLLTQYNRHIKTLKSDLRIPEANLISNFLFLPGIIHLEEKRDINDKIILSAFKEALSQLIAFKEKEGAVIKAEVKKHLKQIRQNTLRIKNLKKPKKENNGSNKDIAEEISLISFYANKLSKLLHTKKEEPKGKLIDFLTQEILRELNAAASKTKGKNISWWLVETKNYLERIREQAQNIE